MKDAELLEAAARIGGYAGDAEWSNEEAVEVAYHYVKRDSAIFSMKKTCERRGAVIVKLLKKLEQLGHPADLAEVSIECERELKALHAAVQLAGTT